MVGFNGKSYSQYVMCIKLYIDLFRWLCGGNYHDDEDAVEHMMKFNGQRFMPLCLRKNKPQENGNTEELVHSNNQ
jgi:hypothetical protein